MSQTLASYNAILPAFSIVADDDGRLSQKNPLGTLAPLSIGGQRLVLPSKAWLKKGFGEDHVPFHPLCEVMSREGTSPVIQLLQRQAKAVISYNVFSLLQGLMKVAVDKESHKDLPIECTDFLKKLSNADKTTAELLDKLLSAATKKNRLLTVYLKNGGKFDGKKVNRSAIIRFPIMEDLQADQTNTNVLGVTIPKKQRPTLIALFKLVLPFGDNPEEYSFGTVARVAPYYTALLTAYHKIATVLNQSINTYGEKLNIPVRPIELFDLDCIDEFSKIYNELPALNGNEGTTKEQDLEASETVVPKKQLRATETVAQVARNENKPVETLTEALVTRGSNGASMDDFMKAINPQPQFNQYPQATPPSNGYFPQGQFPQHNGFNNVTGYGNNGYPTQQPPVGNPYAPIPTAAPWEQQQQGSWGGGPANPFMAATATGRGNGMGLI
ncbi:hypothetical protein ST201phi2-1p126 [Pseudomonas phage 201phi2-1]|uniref:Uncharacterized protein n=1 Tax=Pseudomonas phage 201phi2-1 TaxID=198110 RepID=B3FIY9_BP201|nr:hypothetical protein ST201phi2-1p126 [Pseudomonas phage 201phi2-1]ABY62958.1 hypothetical protein 201phi2-1p126 [Pseudomonas phage 201phi2-1]